MTMHEGGQQQSRGRLIHFPVERTLPHGEKRRHASPSDVGVVLLYRYYTEVGNNYSVYPHEKHTFLSQMQLIAERYNLPMKVGSWDDTGQIREYMFFEQPSEDEHQLCAVVSVAEDGNPVGVSFRKIRHEEPVGDAPQGRRLRIVQNEEE